MSSKRPFDNNLNIKNYGRINKIPKINNNLLNIRFNNNIEDCNEINIQVESNITIKELYQLISQKINLSINSFTFTLNNNKIKFPIIETKNENLKFYNINDDDLIQINAILEEEKKTKVYFNNVRGNIEIYHENNIIQELKKLYDLTNINYIFYQFNDDIILEVSQYNFVNDKETTASNVVNNFKLLIDLESDELVNEINKYPWLLSYVEPINHFTMLHYAIYLDKLKSVEILLGIYKFNDQNNLKTNWNTNPIF